MLDYLIPITIALVGIMVMMFIFQSISKADVSVMSMGSSRKSRSKKSNRRPSRKYREDVLDLATEQLIAREIARNPSGMITDSKTVTPQTLESIRNRRQVQEENQYTRAPVKISERQKQAAKDQGFKVVESTKNAAKSQQQHQQQQPPPSKQEKQSREVEQATSLEELDRKLNLFFKNSSARKTKEMKAKGDEAGVDGSNFGGHVTVKGDLSKARSW